MDDKGTLLFWAFIWFLFGMFVAALCACTIKIDPIIEVQDASVNFGPINVCLPDAGDNG